jgi:hypothetical protein
MGGNDKAENRLAEINRAIAAHPLSSDSVKAAFDVIEKHGKEQKDAIASELDERGLPSLEELGKLQVRTMFSWWKLNRSRRVLLRKLGRA